MAEPTPFTEEQLRSDDLGKKELITYLQENGSKHFQLEHRLAGAPKNITKKKTKDQLIADYRALFESKDFKKEGDEEEDTVKEVTKKTEKLHVKERKDSVEETPRFTKVVMKRGDKKNIPRKGDTVSVWYTGKLTDGTVFDQNVTSAKRGKKPQPLRFKVGAGTVIKGWDQCLKTMSSGEKAEVTIEPEWAYGKKGLEGKIPPNATLQFEMELISIE